MNFSIAHSRCNTSPLHLIPISSQMKTFYDWNQKKVHSNDFLSVLSPLSQSELERQLWNDALLSSLCSPSSDPISSSSLQSLIQSQEGKLGESSRRIEESSHNLKKKLERELSSVRESRKELDQIPSTISKTEDDFLQLCQDLNGNENQIQGNGNGNHTAGEVDAPRVNGKGKQVEDHTLMQSLQAQLQNLDSLKKAKDYLSVLARAQDLHKEVVEPATSSSVALESLSKLSSLLSTVQSLSSSSSTNDSSPLKAINFLKSQRNSAFTLLRDRRIEELSQALSKANWPPSLNQTDKQEASTSYKGKLKDNEEVRKSWKEVCQLQKEAQKLGLMPVANVLKSRTSQDSTSSQETLPGSDHYVGLLAVQTLLSPLLLRFRFHFDGDRNTNRLDKPEWYLSHISNLIKSQSDLFEPIFGDVARLCSRGGLGSEIDLSMELLNGLLTPLRRKIKSSVPLLLPHPSLLAHTILETINFDNELKESHTTARKGVVSISEEILGNQEWFESWLEGERSFCEERFDEFINSPDAWAISKDGMDDEEQATWSTLTSGMGAGSTEEEEDETNSDPSSSGNIAPASNETPTTKSARSLVSLLESVTERYCTLPSLSQRLAFLTRVQLPILRFYLSRLAKSLDAFESLSSAFVRAIPGGIDSSGITSNSDSEMVKGLRGLGRLLKALLSANHISTSLRKWGETSIFIDLAYEMRNSEDGKLLMDEIKKDEDEEDDKELREASLTSLLRRGIRSGTGAARNLRPLGSNKPATSTTTYTDQRYSGQQKSDLHDKEDESEIDSALFDPEVYDEKMNLPSVWDETCQRFQQIEKRASRGIEKLVISEALEVMREYSQR